MQGLTCAEVQSRQQDGLDNSFVANPSKSNWDIIRSNTLTLFNVTNFIIAAAVLAIGSYINSLFILLIIFNITLGIIVEIRARHIMDNLSLLNTDPITVIRDGNTQRILPSDIVLDDMLLLSAGDQVPADATVIDGYAEANEALLTGESDLLVKQHGAELLSGSFIASGQCYARVKHVGADNYSTKLAIEAKQYRPIDSELMRALGVVMKYVSWIALPLGIVLLFVALFTTYIDPRVAILATTAGILGMIPRGMVVLIAVTLVTGVVKLGRRKVLVQEMYSIETMAHLDTLCLDKTGTITEGRMQVADMTVLDDHSNIATQDIHRLLHAYLRNSADNNSTMQALRDAYIDDKQSIEQGQLQKPCEAAQIIPFSSQRKWGAMRFATSDLQKYGTVVLGAPEHLISCELPEVVHAQQDGYRVLMLGLMSDIPDAGAELLETTPIAYITMDDPVRQGAADTLAYLRDQGVDLKIISGDNPKTVSKVAEKAGFPGHECYLDSSTLSDEQIIERIDQTSIFGRVTPHQKKLIVTALRDRGKTVGMTGDGVNDILAMREANLSIAMATGDAATKQIANLVLLNSNFSDMPEILYEARRVVNNMLRSASIFFIKTIYSLLLVVASLVSMFTGSIFLFPFVAIQVTMADQTIGWPTFYLSFRQDKTPVAKKFLQTALLRALPNAVLIVASFIFVHFHGLAQGWTNVETVTLMYCLLGVITFYNVVKACLPLTWSNAAVLLATISGYFIVLLLLGPFIGLGTLTAATAPVFAILVALTLTLWLLWHYLLAKFSQFR